MSPSPSLAHALVPLRRWFAARSRAGRAAALGLLLAARMAAAAAPPVARPDAAGGARHVVVISVDGLRPDALGPERSPAILRLEAEGAATMRARTVRPSVTLPSHASMISGRDVRGHGMTWNDWIPGKGMIAVPTMFDVARRAGLFTALFAGKEKFRHFDRPGSLDILEIPAYAAARVAGRAAACFASDRPHLMLVHLSDVDGAGHKHGWMSREQLAAVARCDRAVATLRAAVERSGLAGRTALIVSADHGGHAKTHGTLAPEDMTIPWIAWGAGVRRGVEVTRPVRTYDTAATALALLGLPVPAGWEGQPVTEALASAPGPGR
jgi:arylsulfatase A-like enzyme